MFFAAPGSLVRQAGYGFITIGYTDIFAGKNQDGFRF
jgi:hypothetical protein